MLHSMPQRVEVVGRGSGACGQAGDPARADEEPLGWSERRSVLTLPECTWKGRRKDEGKERGWKEGGERDEGQGKKARRKGGREEEGFTSEVLKVIPRGQGGPSAGPAGAQQGGAELLLPRREEWAPSLHWWALTWEGLALREFPVRQGYGQDGSFLRSGLRFI